jgi:hypothetical protein
MERPRNTPRRPNKEEARKNTASPSNIAVFKYIEKKLNLPQFPEEGLPIQLLPIILFMSMILMVYIANNHYANKMIINITKTKKEVDELRVDYTYLKAAYMSDSKQSSIAERVEVIGLEESKTPPYKIKAD